MEINLLKTKEEKGLARFTPKSNVPLYFTLGLLVLELLLWGGLVWYQSRIDAQIGALEQEILAVKLETESIEEEREEAVSFQSRLDNLDTLLDKHLFWSPVFEELERYTLSRARFSSVEVDQSGTTLMVSGTVPVYSDLGKMILGLQSSPNLEGVVLESSGLSESETAGYVFDIKISFDPELLEQR